MTITELNEGIISRLATKLKGGIKIIINTNKLKNIKIDSDTACNVSFKVGNELIIGCKNTENNKTEHLYNISFDDFFKKLSIDIGEVLLDKKINDVSAIKFVELYPIFTTNDGALRSHLNPLQKLIMEGYIVKDKNNEEKDSKVKLDVFFEKGEGDIRIRYNVEIAFNDYKIIKIKNKYFRLKEIVGVAN